MTTPQLPGPAQQWRDEQTIIQQAQTDTLSTIETAVDTVLAGIANLRVDNQQISQKQVSDKADTDLSLGEILGILDAHAVKLDQILELLDPQQPQQDTIWGFNAGGYTNLGETQAQALSRISAVFGRPKIIRWWINDFFIWPQFDNSIYAGIPVAANLGSDVAGVLSGVHDDAFMSICAQATRPTFLTFAHEPEDDGFILGNWQLAQMRLAQIKATVGNPLVKFGPLLMGASYHPTRYAGTGPNPIPASQWLDFDRSNCDFIGADCYMWGKTDSDADHAETVIGPARDLALSYGKQLLIGELGARRRSTVSDATRARWITETAAIADSNPALIAAVCYYETDRGAADKVPWCLLPPPGQDWHDPANSPLAVQAMLDILSS